MPDRDERELARIALTALEAQLLGQHAVRLIDIGRERGGIVLRVHVAPGTDRARLAIPERVEGVPVVVLTGDFSAQ